MLIYPKALVIHLKLIKMCIYCKAILYVTPACELLAAMFCFYPKVQEVVLHRREVMNQQVSC